MQWRFGTNLRIVGLFNKDHTPLSIFLVSNKEPMYGVGQSGGSLGASPSGGKYKHQSMQDNGL